jgi:CheY-like chemotaxis protein
VQADVILLVEDSLSDAAIIDRAFSKIGPKYRLMAVTDGQQALNYLSGVGKYADRKTFPLPRMVLLDLQMPNMNGFQVLEWLRKQPSIRHLPVVVLAGSSYSPDIRRAYQAGADSFVTKPTCADAMLDELRLAVAYWAPPGRTPTTWSREDRHRSPLGVEELPG